MKIGINAILYHEKPRGVGHYFDSLIKELIKIDDDNVFYIFYGPWMTDYEFLKIRSEKVKLIAFDVPRGKILRNLYLFTLN